MRFARGDVRDHIVSSKIDHRPPHGDENPPKAVDRQSTPLVPVRTLGFG